MHAPPSNASSAPHRHEAEGARPVGSVRGTGRALRGLSECEPPRLLGRSEQTPFRRAAPFPCA
ncbi:dihydrouridine synthase [Burkholderia pseudomallei S13]|nr:dihydrouridine synthase [Burkholderia pseudomallei S13]